jgi:hypothetical protein
VRILPRISTLNTCGFSFTGLVGYGVTIAAYPLVLVNQPAGDSGSCIGGIAGALVTGKAMFMSTLIGCGSSMPQRVHIIFPPK